MAASKAKAKAKAKTEDVQPDTPAEKVQARITDFLKCAAMARTKSLTLAGLDYAQDLSNTLLDHAKSIENIYKDIQKAVKKKADSKAFKNFLVVMDEKEAASEKFKAGARETHWCGSMTLNV